MSRLRTSLVVTFFSSNGATVALFLVTLALSRLLTPAEVGLFSMAAVLVGIAHTFRDFGVSSYLLQEKELTPEMIRSALGVLYSSSWLMAALLFAASGPIADYMRQTELKPVLQVLALGFVFIPLGSVSHTLLTRDYRAKEQAIATAVGISVYAAAVLGMAYAGFGPMALAWANLINIIASAIALGAFRKPGTPWLPSFRGWGRAVNFGGGALLGGCVSQINAALPDMILGKLSGPHDVGILSRANSTSNIFMQIAGPAVNYAALPYLAQLHHKGESLRHTIGKAVSYLTVCGWPPLAVVAVFSDEVITLLYGVQWIECSPVIRYLCLGAALAMAFNFHGPGLMAIGRPYMALVPGLWILAWRLIIIFALYDGTLRSFTVALVLAGVATVPINLAIQRRFFGFATRQFLRDLLPSLLVAMACLAMSFLVRMAIPSQTPALVTLSILFVVEAATWVLSVYWFRHPFAAELEKAADKVPMLGRVLRRVSRGIAR